MSKQTLDIEAAALLAESELLDGVLAPSGGEDGTKYEIYASRCPSKQFGSVQA